MPEIRARLKDDGCCVPLVGDFHFIGHRLLRNHPECANALDKFRINPGNVGRGNRRDENFSTFIEIARDLDERLEVLVAPAAAADIARIDAEFRERLGAARMRAQQTVAYEVEVSDQRNLAAGVFESRCDFGNRRRRFIVVDGDADDLAVYFFVRRQFQLWAKDSAVTMSLQ